MNQIETDRLKEALELVEDAYREGFGDGAHQAMQYESGHVPREVRWGWRESDSKRERDGLMR